VRETLNVVPVRVTEQEMDFRDAAVDQIFACGANAGAGVEQNGGGRCLAAHAGGVATIAPAVGFRNGKGTSDPPESDSHQISLLRVEEGMPII
jgi:hypothetical protein